MQLEIATSIVDWFNPKDLNHLRAYQNLQKNGMWDVGFLPENIIFTNLWNVAIESKIAQCWIEEKLKDVPDFPTNCRQCKCYDYGSCPFIYKSEACLIRRKERLCETN